jgi:hypothetical protein
MAQIPISTEEISHETIQLHIPDADMPFANVRTAARDKAREINSQAMMLAWYDAHADRGYPDYECSSERPFWEMFAESRGGNLRIEVNDGAYVFIFLKL